MFQVESRDLRKYAVGQTQLRGWEVVLQIVWPSLDFGLFLEALVMWEVLELAFAHMSQDDATVMVQHCGSWYPLWESRAGA
eukprot:4994644-Amphidinium_carterae.1